VNKNTIVCSLTDDASDQNYDTMNENYEKLKNFTDTGGNHFHIIPLVLPKNRMEFDGERLPCTYANFYIGNGFVVVPQYGDPNDQIALKTLADIFLDKQVIGLKSKYLIHGGGSFHCVTQQQPSGEF
jgi:agmatine deiminase